MERSPVTSGLSAKRGSFAGLRTMNTSGCVMAWLQKETARGVSHVSKPCLALNQQSESGTPGRRRRRSDRTQPRRRCPARRSVPEPPDGRPRPPSRPARYCSWTAPYALTLSLATTGRRSSVATTASREWLGCGPCDPPGGRRSEPRIGWKAAIPGGLRRGPFSRSIDAPAAARVGFSDLKAALRFNPGRPRMS
jgi:hypothetical protein